jgi:hypothetical protein
MTEAEWIQGVEPGPMLKVCSGWDRKLRLFACACARESVAGGTGANGDWFWDNLELSERFAEGDATAEECQERAKALDDSLSPFNFSYFQVAVIDSLATDASDAAGGACADAASGLERKFAPPGLPWHLQDSRKAPIPWLTNEVRQEAQKTIQDGLAKGNAIARALLAGVLREVFGNPFRPVAFDPAWRTSDVFLLARGVYEDRAFDRMPILADALQDAGCDSADILGHLRDTNATHVRGCWALDLVLGKE